MPKKPLEAIEEHFSKVNDPCQDRTKDHKLIGIIAIANCAVICRAEGWVARDTAELMYVNAGVFPILNT